jgi:hypothetical protein
MERNRAPGELHYIHQSTDFLSCSLPEQEIATMSSLIWLALPALLALVLVSKFVSNGKVPPEQTFRCAKCGTRSAHNERTIEAWRQGKQKLFLPQLPQNLANRKRIPSPERPTAGGTNGLPRTVRSSNCFVGEYGDAGHFSDMSGLLRSIRPQLSSSPARV